MTATDTDTPAEETAPEPREPCLCGCGGIPTRKRSRFLPGHDAQLKARLYATIRDEATSDQDRQAAVQRLDDFGWPQPAPKRTPKPKAEETPAEG